MKVCFVFPYKKIGGVSVVFAQIAESLQENYGCEVFVVDYINGALSKIINKNKIKFLQYSDSKIIHLPEDAYIVFQGMTPWSIFPNLKINKNSKIFFWALHFSNFLPLLPGIRTYMQSNNFIFHVISKTILISWFIKSRNFVKFLMINKAVAFYESDAFTTTSKLLNLNLNEAIFLRVPYEIKNQYHLKINTKYKNQLRFLYLGRIVDFKYYSLALTIKHLNKYIKKNKIKAKFTIIGTGNYHEKLKYISTKYANIEFEFIDDIANQDLAVYLKDNFDIAFAMGTSALTCASAGLATILLDISYKPIKENYKFSWLFTKQGKTLGENITKKHYSKYKNHLERLINEYIKNPNEISKKSYDYSKKYHSIDSTASQLLIYLKQSKVRYESIKNKHFFRKDIIYNFFKNLSNKKSN